MDEFDMFDITKSDWIGLRLLSLILCTDVSSSNIKDIQRSMDYYTERYSREAVMHAIFLINRERVEKDVWHNPESKLIRGMKPSEKKSYEYWRYLDGEPQ